MDADAAQHLVEYCNGDARNLLNALELAVESSAENADGEVPVHLDAAQESIQKRALSYDKGGDAHYDTISAFIKSVRGSNPDAALYWLAKMLEAGEDPRFILRRLIILAGEDIGLADPHGIQVATAAAQAFDYIGLPEGIFPIVEATLYLATAPKSNSALAYFQVVERIHQEGEGNVPMHLMDGSRDARGLGHGKGYLYPHSYPDHFVDQQYLPDSLKDVEFYQPSNQGYEAVIAERLNSWRRRRNEKNEPTTKKIEEEHDHHPDDPTRGE